MRNDIIKQSQSPQIAQHSSIDILSQKNVDEIKVIFTQQAHDAINTHVRIFKDKFVSLKDVIQDYSSIELLRCVLENKDIYLAKLCERLNNLLCDQFGVVILKNFLIDDYQEDIDIATFVFGCYLGLPMYNNRDKVYIWPIVSRQIDSSKKLDGNIRNGNTGSPLSFHTDTTTYAGLLCLKQSQKGGENELISTAAVHNRIFETRKDLLEILYAPFFIDRRGEQMNGEKPYAEIPIFGMTVSGRLMTHWSKSYTHAAYNKYNIPRLSAIQVEALDYLINVIEMVACEKKVEIKSETGDLILCNNNLIFHNRKPFIGDRHLLRVWIYSDRYQSFPHMFGYSPL